jgi:hypothetical protein
MAIRYFRVYLWFNWSARFAVVRAARLDRSEVFFDAVQDFFNRV